MGFQVIIIAVFASIMVGENTCNSHMINFNFSYNSFDINIDAPSFKMSGASIVSRALHLTQDSNNKNPQYSLTNVSGSALLKKNFRVCYGSKSASFNTSFVFNIQRVNGNGGEGLAFIITSNNDLPANSSGKWLGLLNASTNGRNSTKVVAVEFDTSKSLGTNDPDGNHVGINVNSINSTNFTSLPADQINLTGNYDIQAWIQYNGNTKKLDVYVANMSDPMPSKATVSAVVDLSKVLDSKSYFGFSASTGIGTEIHVVKAWNFIIEPVSLPNWGLIIFLSVFLPLTLGATICILLLLKRRKSQAEEENKIFEEIEKIPGQLREFRYKDLKKATNNFSPTALLGSGGFGTVYKGIMPKGKNVVAVKRMTRCSKQGKEEFISEVSIINRLRHRNLVPLLGWCHKKGQLIMVYEFMPNCSLDKHIFNEEYFADGFLDWQQRYNIVSGVASALLYLHEECDQQVIHRDVKASNIMLDSEYKARLGDFGLARLIEHDRRSFTATGIVGTPGYIAPEYYHTGRATTESDVFSFGAVALEVTCGRPPRSSSPDSPDLVGWVWKLYRQNDLLEAADSRLAKFGSVNINEGDVKRLLMLGLACSNPIPAARPTMREVTQVLARAMPPPYVPPFRPAFVWPHRPTDLSFANASTINSIASFDGVVNSLNTLLPSSDSNQNARRLERMTL